MTDPHRIIAEMLPCSHEPRDGETLGDRGADALDPVELELALSERLGVRLAEPLEVTMTVGEVCALVERAVARNEQEVL